MLVLHFNFFSCPAYTGETLKQGRQKNLASHLPKNFFLIISWRNSFYVMKSLFTFDMGFSWICAYMIRKKQKNLVWLAYYVNSVFVMEKLKHHFCGSSFTSYGSKILLKSSVKYQNFIFSASAHTCFFVTSPVHLKNNLLLLKSVLQNLFWRFMLILRHFFLNPCLRGKTPSKLVSRFT